MRRLFYFLNLGFLTSVIGGLFLVAEGTASNGGMVTTLAGLVGVVGSTNGQGTAASFCWPTGIAVDSSGNVYVSDNNRMIRKISPDGVVVTLAGLTTMGAANGSGTLASFKYPEGIAVDTADNLYVADTGNFLIRKITPEGIVSTLAGSGSRGSNDGTGTTASFGGPAGVAVDSLGNVYVADMGNNLIRKVTPGGVVMTLAGSGARGSDNGVGTAASFNGPTGVAVDAVGNIYVTDASNEMIRKITPGGVVTKWAGSGSVGMKNGPGAVATFHYPIGIAIDHLNNLYVADMTSNLIRKITPDDVVTTMAGSGHLGTTNGVGSAASFKNPKAIAIDSLGNIYVADSQNQLIRKIKQ
jgi:sugar lactone lactonase YvrE